MARLNRRKRHCQAATVASQIARRRKQGECRENPEMGSEFELQADQQPVMEADADAFVQSETAMVEESTMKFTRGCQVSKQTIWPDKNEYPNIYGAKKKKRKAREGS